MDTLLEEATPLFFLSEPPFSMGVSSYRKEFVVYNFGFSECNRVNLIAFRMAKTP